jgi:uncharacterized protein YfdQ (DUF2303 family)
MSNDRLLNESETIRDLSVSIGETRRVNSESIPHAIVPNGYTVTDLERLLPTPARIRFKPAFVEPESFNRYVNEHKNEDTRVFGNEESSSIIAVVDMSKKDGPAWHGHQPVLKLAKTPEWFAWMKSNRQTFTQESFAEFLEEHASEIFEPSAATMLEIAMTLKGKNDVSWSSATRLDNGAVSLGYSEEVRGVAGKGDLQIPTRFKISVVVFKGTAPFILECLLRWRFTKEDGVTFTYIVREWEKAEQQAFRDVLAMVYNATEIQPFVGPG